MEEREEREEEKEREEGNKGEIKTYEFNVSTSGFRPLSFSPFLS